MNLTLDGTVYHLENDMSDYSWAAEIPTCPECDELLEFPDTGVWAHWRGHGSLECGCCGHEMDLVA